VHSETVFKSVRNTHYMNYMGPAVYKDAYPVLGARGAHEDTAGSQNECVPGPLALVARSRTKWDRVRSGITYDARSRSA